MGALRGREAEVGTQSEECLIADAFHACQVGRAREDHCGARGVARGSLRVAKFDDASGERLAYAGELGQFEPCRCIGIDT